MNDMDDDSLFAANVSRPLADRMRPHSLDEIVGQDHLLGEGAPLRRMIDSGRLASFILWGPPGCGKTTLARIMATKTQLHFVALSAVFSGIADLRKAFDEAKKRRVYGEGTLLFIDEIHRFNRAQQDGFLPYVENGTVVLVGATTENPSFELNSALLSRCKVFILNALDAEALGRIVTRAETLLGRPLPVTPEARAGLIELADGDGRYLINLLESVYDLTPAGVTLDAASLLKLVQQRAPVYDKDREGHYNLISAVHKSLRGSDTDAALYWAARMLEGGEDPLYLLRRLTRFAMEDVSLADPQALPMALGRVGRLRAARVSGGRSRHCGAGHLPRQRAEVEQRLRGLGKGAGSRESPRFADAAAAHPECADEAHGRGRLRKRVCLRPRHRGRLLRAELFPGENGPPEVLRSARARLRAGDPQTPRLLGAAAPRKREP